jgi:AraC-like DNA-binding protein
MEMIGLILSNLRASTPFLTRSRSGADRAIAITESKASPFHYVLSGGCRVATDNHSVDLEAGDLSLMPRGPAFRLEVGNPTATSSVDDLINENGLTHWAATDPVDRPLVLDVGEPPFETSLLGGHARFSDPLSSLLLPHLPEIMVFKHVGGALERWLTASASFVAEEEAKWAPGYNAVATRVIELLLVTALRDWFLDPRNHMGGLLGLFDPVVSRALLAMHDRPSERWSLLSLAAAAGCSRASFAKRFHSLIGETPFEYLTRMRISLAATRLLQTQQSVATIASELGYSSSFALTRAFAQIMNQTPSAYRRSQSPIAQMIG